MHQFYILLVGLSAGVVAAPHALAQRTAANVVAQADDAFGSTVGDEKIGIYTTTNVRGFSPVSAGNIRVEGLSFDRPATFTGRLIAGNTIRVGIAAQGYPFPAPTGIVDFKLRKPSTTAITSVGAAYGPLDGKYLEVDAQRPIDGERLGITFGAGRYLDASAYGSESTTNAMALSARFAPNGDVEIQPFFSRITHRDDEAQPLIFTVGGIAPNAIRAGTFFGQSWTDSKGISDNYGVITHWRNAGAANIDIRAGLLRSIWRVNTAAADLMLNVDSNGNIGNRNIVLQGDDTYAATSAEIRFSRNIIEGARKHTFLAMLKARKASRDYGGAQTLTVNTATIGEQDERPAPTRQVTANDAADRIMQTTAGLGYQGLWSRVGELSVGLQRADYEKTATSSAQTARAAPLLPSATAALHFSTQWIAYAGYTRGLEESPNAPIESTNRNESPPSIITIQKEAGVRWKTSNGMSTVLGVFDIEKPYFNLNAARQFIRLGSVRHRGIELSATGKITSNLTAVLGNLIIDRRVSNTDGNADKMPIGAFKRQTFLNLDYTLPHFRDVSLSAAVESTSRRVSNAANTAFLAPRTIVNLGLRHRFKVADKPALLRLRTDNMFNKFAWDVSSSGAFTVNSPRRITVDFGVDL